MGMFNHLTPEEKHRCYEEFKASNEGRTSIADLSPSRVTNVDLEHDVTVMPKFVGVPQGAPTSPYLSTIVL